MKGCTCIFFYIEVAGILNLVCAIWKQYQYLQHACAFFNASNLLGGISRSFMGVFIVVEFHIIDMQFSLLFEVYA